VLSPISHVEHVDFAGFGSTATIAYPLILQTYGSNSEAMTTALIIGEFGSCIPFYTIGILILAYFGGRSAGSEIHYLSVIRDFMKTPVFLSIAGGLLVSMIPPLSDLMTTTYFTHLFSYFLNGFEMIVAITIGLMLRPISVRSILQYIAISVPLAVIVMPLLVYLGSGIFGVPQIIKEILVIEASVPSGAVAAVMAERYGCDGSTASVLVIVSFLASFLTLPLISIFLL
jgi:malate permease and related proteins